MSRAIILAGGQGVRLRPYTVALPKPLMPIGDYPILEIVVRQLVRNGFKHITMAVNHQADIIKAFFQDGAKWGLKIDYSLEDKPLSTMGPLKLIPDLPEHFLVMNGDVLSDVNYHDFLTTHVTDNKTFTILSHVRKDRVDYGVLKTNTNNKLIGFEEKPVNTYLVSMGIYAASRRILSEITEGVPFGFDDLMRCFLAKDESVSVVPYGGYWMDIGRPEDYAQASKDFSKLKERLGI